MNRPCCEPDVKTVNQTQEAIRNVSPELKQFIADSFKKTISETINDSQNLSNENYMPSDILSVAMHHKKVLEKSDLSSLCRDDQKIVKLYQSGLINLINQRKYTALLTDFLVKFTDLLLWISIYLEFPTKIICRRKGLVPHFAKLFLKTVNLVKNPNNSFLGLQPVLIRDLFGCRLITKEDLSIDELKKFINTFIPILTDSNSDQYKNFYSWVEKNQDEFGGMPIPKEELLAFKKYSFSFDYEKNYLDEPKGSYHSWQVTITLLDAPNLNLCGKMFEFQVRTFSMHKNATIGDAAQDEYKKKFDQFISEVFSITDYNGGLELFDNELDELGILYPIIFYQRQVSGHIMPVTS